MGHGISLGMRGANRQATTSVGTRKASGETSSVAESYLKQHMHCGAIYEGTATRSQKAPPPGPAAELRTTAQHTRGDLRGLQQRLRLRRSKYGLRQLLRLRASTHICRGLLQVRGNNRGRCRGDPVGNPSKVDAVPPKCEAGRSSTPWRLRL